MSSVCIFASAQSAWLKIFRSRPISEKSTTHLLELPAEILLQILEQLGLPRLYEDWVSQARKGRPAGFPSELKNLRLVCRRVDDIIRPHLKARIAPERGINETAKRFHEILKSCACPELVQRLRLCWERPSNRLLDLKVLLKPFPALTMVEIVRLRPQDWSDLATALAKFPNVRMLKVKIDVLCHGDYQGMTPPPAAKHSSNGPSDGLLRIQRLSIQFFRTVYDLSGFLAWFGCLEHLVVCPMASPTLLDKLYSGLAEGLRHSRVSLKTLEVSGLPGSGSPLAWGDRPDLRFLVSLECFSFTGYMRMDRQDRCYKDLRLPPCVNTVVYARRDYQWDDKNSLTYGEQAAFRYFVDSRNIVAPGLQRLILRISEVDERGPRSHPTNSTRI